MTQAVRHVNHVCQGDDNGFRIRWFIKRDLPAILRVEQACFADPWTAKDFRGLLMSSEHNNVCQVIEHGDCLIACVVGYMIYSYQPGAIEIVNVAVHPAWHRRGLGSKMVAKICSKLSARWPVAIANVHEGNLPCQKLLGSLGFVATAVLRRHFGEHDAYRMEWNAAL